MIHQHFIMSWDVLSCPYFVIPYINTRGHEVEGVADLQMPCVFKRLFLEIAFQCLWVFSFLLQAKAGTPKVSE